MNEVMAIKFYHQSLEKRFVDAILMITPIKQMRNNYMQCFNMVEFVVIFFYEELPWYKFVSSLLYM